MSSLLQQVYTKWTVEAGEILRAVAEDIAARINAGEPLGAAVDAAFRGYPAEMAAAYSQSLGAVAVGATYATSISVEASRAADYFLTTAFEDGLSLSARLHSGEVQRIVKDSMRQFFAAKTSVETLFKRLRDGGVDSFDGIPAEIQRAVLALEEAGGDVAAVTDELRRARQYVGKLSGVETSSAQLQAAYSRVLDAIAVGEPALVTRAVDRAVVAKVGYIHKRIARTETARAYEMTFQRAMVEDPGITGFQVVLSSRHPEPDICDVYAHADMYGMGDGRYPVDAGVNIPFHPHCLCSKVPLRGGQPARFSESAARGYIGELDEKTRKKVIGKETNYIKGLENAGFAISRRPAMIPETLFTPRGTAP